MTKLLTILEQCMTYTHYGIWFLGALLLVALLLIGLQQAVWYLYGNIVGWPTISKAMRLYREQDKKG